MRFVIARAEWHGLSLEDLAMAVAGLIFAVLLAGLLGADRDPARGEERGSAPGGAERTAMENEDPGPGSPVVDADG